MMTKDIQMKLCILIVLWYHCNKIALSQDVDNAGRCLKLGIIAEGERPGITNQVITIEYNITAVWTFVNFKEIYDIFRTVRRYDNSEDIDLILLHNYDAKLPLDPQLLHTKRKQLVLSPGKRTYPSNNSGQSQNSEVTDACNGDSVNFERQESQYCKMEIDGKRNSSMSTEFPSNIGSRMLVNLVVEVLHWKYVIIIHQNETALEVQDLIDKLSKSRVLFTVYNIDSTGDFHGILNDIYETTVRLKPEMNFVLICRPNCARRVLHTANQFDAQDTKQKTLMKQFSRWLVVIYGHTQSVSRNLNACADDLDNVAIIAVPDVNGPTSQDLPGVFENAIRDLYTEGTSNRSEAHLSKQHMIETLTKKILTWSPASLCQGYNIDTLLWTASGRGFSTVGFVNKYGDVTLTSEVFPNTRYGYNKRRFTVSTLEYDPFVIKRAERGIDPATGNVTIRLRYEGFTMDLLDELARVLNFTYTIIEPADQKWGGLVIKENYTFNGLIGQLQNEECDLVAAPISIQSDREIVVDFSYPFFYEYTTVLVKKPNLQTQKWRTLIDPFKWEVLVSIGLALAVVTVLIFLLEKYNPFYSVPAYQETRAQNGGLHYLHNTFWYMYGALLCQGGVHLPDSVAGRTFVSCWWLMCIVVVGIYSGNLIAFLTVTKEKPPFNTLKEMVDTSGYTWGTLGATNWETVFLTSNLPIFKKIGDGIREFNKTDTGVLNTGLAYHFDRVKEGGYAWIGDKTAIEIVMSTECDLISIKDEFLPMKYAIGFPNNSPHNAFFSEQIMKLHESGLLQIWKRKWWPKSNFCAASSVPTAKPISLMDVQSAFYVCVVGTFIGTVAFLAEIVVFKISRSRNQQRAMVRCVSNISTEDQVD